ncbi:hypothetical protein AB3S75_018775 [Citrus x aurantiifolia]
MWRALLNILPTANNLYRRKILDSPYCPRCHIAKEDALHALLIRCKMTRKVCELSNVAEILDKNSFTDFYSASLYLHSSLPKEKFEGFVALAWSVWRARNLTLFTKEGMDISSTLIRADRVSQAYKDAQETCIKSIGAPLVSIEERWFSPDRNWFYTKFRCSNKQG